MYTFHDLESQLRIIAGTSPDVGNRMIAYYMDHRHIIDEAPGSRKSHHTWEGGYKAHVEQCMNIYSYLTSNSAALNRWAATYDSPEERFLPSDGYVVLFFHDIEKPFMYHPDGGLPSILTKEERKYLRALAIDSYGIQLSPAQQNALDFVEGARDDQYIPGERPEWPLAALCHAADFLSARVLYNVKAPL